MPASQPNILILMADQLTPGALPAYGHGLTKAPLISRLAREGVVFDAAYCASPLCAPSRYALMSGALPSRTGGYDNAADFPADIPTFAHVLRHAGYRTILSGKMHFIGADQLHGFEERLTTDIYPADYGWTPDWIRPEHRPSWYHNMSSVLDAGPCVRTNQLDFDDEVTFAAERALYDQARGRDRRPFLLVVSLTHPHDPFAIPQRYWDLYSDDEIDPPRVPEPPVPQDPHSLRLRHVCAMDAAPITPSHVRAARRAYYGAISYVDEQWTRVTDALERTGLAEGTVTFVLSDHGEMLGERGSWYKMSFFEGAARVPLIVHAPDRFAPGRVGAAVSLLDLLPTLAELGGAQEVPEAIDGRSLVPYLRGKGGRDEAMGEYLAEGALAPIVMLRRGAYKFVHSASDPDQLYDLDADPLELTNLAASRLDLAASFREEVARRWDLEALNQDVLTSQRRRRFVGAALRQGAQRSWDFQPVRDASRQYVRSHMELDDLEATARFPRVVDGLGISKGG